MKPAKRCAVVVLCCLLLSSAGPVRLSFANLAVGMSGPADHEVVNCYFGAFRKDGKIMVNMVPGAAGKLYSLSSATVVLSNGVAVSRQTLTGGLPIVLQLNGQKTIDVIRIR